MTNSNHDWSDSFDPGVEQDRNHERFLELCAVATSGPLSEREASQLQAHLEECAECREAMAEFRFVALEGASLLVPADSDPNELVSQRSRLHGLSAENSSRARKAAKQELFARIAENGSGRDARPGSARVTGGPLVPGIIARLIRQQKLQFSVAALLLVGAVAVAAYRYGAVHVGGRGVADRQYGELQTHFRSERSALEQQLKSRTASIDDLTGKLEERTATVQELKRKLVETEFLERRHESELNTALTQTTSIEGERDALLRRLLDAEASLVSLRGELDSLRVDKGKDLLRISSLETRIDELDGQLKESHDTVAQQQDFLVSDRDIRELMGARSLYITDVLDVDKNGHTKKPFGRIFYTKGKSLVFYAFDLDQQRGLHNAAFQLWGQKGSDRSGSVNMGIFYLDNEANRRWVLKFDDPETLAQINAVFVTVEPNGGSQRPAGKQLLYASLRTLPNHP